ncbi:GDCCVxC domain-containing (seleno)protein [Hyphobacterium sp.]|uniref:GDCCVxC domain-containing (seleno)protein n=1 Tax=Hyphobacterium sp. TaxID=2004662 RepID=UPI003B522F68
MADIVLHSSLTCPSCDITHASVPMPTDACQYFWDCPACGDVIKPLNGDCCVFCSYGSVPCPPIQRGACC